MTYLGVGTLYCGRGFKCCMILIYGDPNSLGCGYWLSRVRTIGFDDVIDLFNSAFDRPECYETAFFVFRN